MFKEKNNFQKEINNNQLDIKVKKKSKSINNRNLTNNRIKTKKFTTYVLPSNNYIKENSSIYNGGNKPKRNSRIEIDSNKAINTKNVKRNNNKKLTNNIYTKEIQFPNIENKENIFNGNIIKSSNTSNNYFKKNRKNKSLNNKNKVISEHNKETKNIKFNKKEELKKNDNKKEIDNNNIKEESNTNLNKPNEKNIVESKNNIINNKNLDKIIKEINICNLDIEKEKKYKEINIEDKTKEIEEIKEICCNEETEKNDKNLNTKNKEISNKKIPILKLDCESSSKSKNNSKGDESNSESSESSFESYGLEVKGELLIKNKKTNFLNNLKKCLFNKDSNIQNISNNINSNSNTNFNTEGELKFKNTISLQKRKTAEFSNNYRINLKENISLSESQINEKKIKIYSSKITRAGLNDNNPKTNQDSYLILENIFNQQFNIYGIFDGHGENGHLISNLVSKFLSQYFTNKKNYFIPKKNNSDDSDSKSSSSIKTEDIEINEEEISKIFENNNFIENTIYKLVEKANEANFNIDFSGTTCNLVFLLENKIICSNIGDSQCVLFKCSNEDRWNHEVISIIHKPDDPKEKERIIEMGGLVHPYYDENGIYEGPNRVYAKNKTYPGLSLSRSIGDLIGEEIGIISEPDIVIKEIDSTCKYLILGSDGLWDVIKPYDAIRIVNPYFNKKDPEGACKALLKRASKNWEKDGSDRDDITIIIVFIGKPN